MSNDHIGLPVAGYQPQPQVNVDLVNQMKRLEENVLRALDALANGANDHRWSLDALANGADQRWLAIGRTHIEQGFMAVNRSIFKPKRVEL